MSRTKQELVMNVDLTSWAEAVYYLKSFAYTKGHGSSICFQRSAASRVSPRIFN